MSAINDDGGPAFPNNDQHGCAFPGMTLRDWFAGQALASMDYGWFMSSTRIQEMSAESYAIADAMLAARKGGAHE